MRFGYRVHSQVLRYIWRRWRDQITPAGKLLLSGVCIATLGAVSVEFPAYQLFCALTVTLALAEFVGVVLTPSVELVGKFPEKAVAGEPVSGAFTVTNRSIRPIFDLSLGFFGLPASLQPVDNERIVPYLGHHESMTIPVTLLPRKRGFYELPPLRAYSTFPFNLVRSGMGYFPMRPLLVLPAFRSVEGINIAKRNRYQAGGIALTSSIGESTEYIGNREYVPGEPARRLDFRSWARLGQPVVREYHEEYFVRIALVLDTFVPPREQRSPKGSPRLEAGISLAAGIAETLTDGEYLVDMFAAGRDVHVFRAGRRSAYLDHLLEILACIEPSATNPFDILLPTLSEEFPRLSTVICIFLDWDAARRGLVDSALEAGCSTKLFLITPDSEKRSTSSEVVDMPDADLVCLSSQEIQGGGIRRL